MRTFFISVMLTAILTGSAEAQSTWQEYVYREQQFAVSFPGQPAITTMPFTTAAGMTVMQTVYSVRQETGVFQVAVIDLSMARLDGMAAIDQAVAALRATGDVKLDIEARVQANYGRDLNI